MALPAEAVPRYTYPDLAAFPEDLLRREIIDGELVVNPAPIIRHQRASGNLQFRLKEYANKHGGEVFSAPCDVYLSAENVVEPDLIFVRADHLDRIGVKYLDGPPDLVIEISSPSTRRLDTVRKRELYQRFGVPAYWFVDLEAERVEIYLLEDGAYPGPQLKYPGENLESPGLPGLSVPVSEALAPEQASTNLR